MGTIIGFTKHVNSYLNVSENKNIKLYDSFLIYFDHTTATISRYLLNRELVNRDNKLMNILKEEDFIRYSPPTLNKFHKSEYENINDYFFNTFFADKMLTLEEVNKKKKRRNNYLF